LDIDVIRSALGRWEAHSESKTIARALATNMARVHLLGGRDVVIPQFVARVDLIGQLAQLADDAQARFVEILLLDTVAGIENRFRARRTALAGSAEQHPQHDVVPGQEAEVLDAALKALLRIAQQRPNTRVINTTDGQVGAYQAVIDAVAHRA
jgi:hypothetical protein